MSPLQPSRWPVFHFSFTGISPTPSARYRPNTVVFVSTLPPHIEFLCHRPKHRHAVCPTMRNRAERVASPSPSNRRLTASPPLISALKQSPWRSTCRQLPFPPSPPVRPAPSPPYIKHPRAQSFFPTPILLLSFAPPLPKLPPDEDIKSPLLDVTESPSMSPRGGGVE
jgi:hypothetical protein